MDVYQPAVILIDRGEKVRLHSKINGVFHKDFTAFVQHLISTLLSKGFQGCLSHHVNVCYRLSNKRND